MTAQRTRGFTLIEIMITVAILAIVASVALPSYSAYVQRSRVPAALEVLSTFGAKMELAYQDSGKYGTATCSAVMGTAPNFTESCTLTNSGQGYIATMTGSGPMAGYTYTINHLGARATTAHPKGSNATCWTTKGTICDI